MRSLTQTCIFPRLGADTVRPKVGPPYGYIVRQNHDGFCLWTHTHRTNWEPHPDCKPTELSSCIRSQISMKFQILLFVLKYWHHTRGVHWEESANMIHIAVRVSQYSRYRDKCLTIFYISQYASHNMKSIPVWVSQYDTYRGICLTI